MKTRKRAILIFLAAGLALVAAVFFWMEFRWKWSANAPGKPEGTRVILHSSTFTSSYDLYKHAPCSYVAFYGGNGEVLGKYAEGEEVVDGFIVEGKNGLFYFFKNRRIAIASCNSFAK